jgi:glyoxylase-like metal-dependent hydrolase (beta-lactamase superfamily II)
MADRDYVIEPIVSAPFDEVSYIAQRRGEDQALVVDPGFDPEAILGWLQRQRLGLAAILNTHGHADHIAGNAAVKRAYPEAPLIIGAREAGMLSDPDANLSAPFGMPITSPPADRLVSEGERIEVAGFSFLVREIPGHSPGSVVFVCDQFDPPFVFGGDVLFAGSVGRVDFPGGSAEALLGGIRSKLFTMPDATTVYPGHGPSTTIGAEKQSNPYVGERSGLIRLE